MILTDSDLMLLLNLHHTKRGISFGDALWYRSLERNGLVFIEPVGNHGSGIPGSPDVTITEKGKRAVSAGFAAMRNEAKR